MPDNTQVLVEQWKQAQPDLIECPLGGWLRLSACRYRQNRLLTLRTHKGYSVDDSASDPFVRCSIVGCKHFKPSSIEKKMTPAGIFKKNWGNYNQKKHKKHSETRP